MIDKCDVDAVADTLRSNSAYGAEDAGIHELLGFLQQHMAKADGLVDVWEFEELVHKFYLRTGVKEMRHLIDRLDSEETKESQSKRIFDVVTTWSDVDRDELIRMLNEKYDE